MKTKKFIEIISEYTGTKVKAEECFRKILSCMEDNLKTGESVWFNNIGILKPGIRKARKGKNPITNEPIDIPEKRVVKFSISSSLSKMMNNNK